MFNCQSKNQRLFIYWQVGSEIWKMYRDSQEITKNFIDNWDTSTSIQTLEKVKKRSGTSTSLTDVINSIYEW